jgi:hypothetical protein
VLVVVALVVVDVVVVVVTLVVVDVVLVVVMDTENQVEFIQ